VERLLHERALVTFCGLTRESADQSAAPRQYREVSAYATDVQKVHLFSVKLPKLSGEIDILINNAGTGIFRKVGDMTLDDWHRNIDLNLNAPFYLFARGTGALSKAR
jgi:NAD(P)-dependent dehydrogenase (short-subunit alcohol dehydrogenase family)